MRPNKINNTAFLLAIAGMIILAGCAATATPPQQSLVQLPAQPNNEQPVQKPAQQEVASEAPQGGQPVAPAQNFIQQNSGSATVSTVKPGASNTALSNRVDVIYFHTKLRCVTCLCFEEHISKVINKYFQDEINSGKLTFRVLNVQDPKNAVVAKKYRALGSQLFINNVTNDFDNIEDIQDIWYWDCVDDPDGFEMKVKNIIELRLKGQR